MTEGGAKKNNLIENFFPHSVSQALKQLLSIQLKTLFHFIFTFELPLWRSEGKNRYGKWLFIRRGDVSSLNKADRNISYRALVFGTS